VPFPTPQFRSPIRASYHVPTLPDTRPPPGTSTRLPPQSEDDFDLSQSEDSHVAPQKRADTLPSYIDAVSVAVSAEPEEDLPHNPKTWTPSQLSVYLTAALHVRSGARLPERVARDITSWVRREAVTGRAFLRWTDEDLKS
jgi:hypothetical protein